MDNGSFLFYFFFIILFDGDFLVIVFIFIKMGEFWVIFLDMFYIFVFVCEIEN